jgi:hypothetical protein
MLPLAELRDDGERRLVASFAALAHDPLSLEAFITEMHAACRGDDFPAERYDPLARRGWCPLGQHIRFPKVEPWQRDMTDLIADLRADTMGLDREQLTAAIGDNIRALPSSYATPKTPRPTRAPRHDAGDGDHLLSGLLRGEYLRAGAIPTSARSPHS